MGLGILKKTGFFILGTAVLMSAMPCIEVLAAGQYPFIYDGSAQENDSMALTEDVMALTEILEDYTVLPDDSLWKIAEQQLGNGNDYLALADANRDIIADPDLIYPGMCLKISRTGYLRKDERSRGGASMGQYAMDTPYGWTIGLTQSGNAGANFVMRGDGEIACLIQDKTKAVSADVSDWQECMEQIRKYIAKNYPKQVSDLSFEHYRMDNQGDASGELYLYSYVWHISPDDYPSLTCRVCAGLKLTEHIQAEFIGYTPHDYDIQSCVRYVTATFEEHFAAENGKDFSVNDSNMSIVPESTWQLKGIYNSFAYIDEYFSALLNQALTPETDMEEKSRYRGF